MAGQVDVDESTFDEPVPLVRRWYWIQETYLRGWRPPVHTTPTATSPLVEECLVERLAGKVFFLESRDGWMRDEHRFAYAIQKFVVPRLADQKLFPAHIMLFEFDERDLDYYMNVVRLTARSPPDSADAPFYFIPLPVQDARYRQGRRWFLVMQSTKRGKHLRVEREFMWADVEAFGDGGDVSVVHGLRAVLNARRDEEEEEEEEKKKKKKKEKKEFLVDFTVVEIDERDLEHYMDTSGMPPLARMWDMLWRAPLPPRLSTGPLEGSQ